MKVFSILFCLVSASDPLLSYKLNQNFGQRFHDYSKNRFDGTNGETTAKDPKDTIATDRGAYFYEGDKEINLPLTNPDGDFLFDTSKIYLIFWVNFETTQSRSLSLSEDQIKANIFRRFGNNENSFSMFLLSDNTLKIELEVDGKSNSFYSGYSLKLATWQFIGVFIKDSKIELYLNADYVKTKDLDFDYIDNCFEIGFAAISGESDMQGFNGYLYEFAIYEDDSSFNDLVNSGSGNCFGGGCESYCSPAMVDQGGDTFCVSVEKDYFVNSNGDNCPAGCDGGCAGTTCLKCDCVYLSCVLLAGNSVCWCPDNIAGTTTECYCGANSSGEVFDGLECETKTLDCGSGCRVCVDSKCLFCQDLNAVVASNGISCECSVYYTSISNICTLCPSNCKTCDISGSCLSCISYNSSPSPYSLGECICNQKFYNENELTHKYSCKSCNSQCLTCSTADRCKTCIADNTVIENGVCKCKNEYYNSGDLSSQSSCSLCNSDCKTCEDGRKCLTCKVLNAIKGKVSGCQCPDDSVEIDGECFCNDGFNMTLQDQEPYCYKCHKTCQLCNGTSSSNCLSCIEGLNFNQGSCDCPEQQYFNGTVCRPCEDHCLKCTRNKSKSGSICINCEEGFYEENGVCIKNCSTRSYYNGSECISCEKLCQSCNNSDCIECTENSIQSSNKSCECLQGFNGSDYCTRVYFKGELKRIGVNSIYLMFEDNLNINLTKLNFTVWLNNSNIKCSVVLTQIDTKLYRFKFVFKSDVPSNTFAFIEILSTTEIISVSNYLLLDYNYSISLPEYKLPYVSSKTTQALANATAGVARAAISSSFLSGILSSPAFLWSFLNNLELIALLPLNSIPYPDSLKEFFSSFVGFSIFPNPMTLMNKVPKSTRPYVEAYQYGFNTYLFYFNAGTYIWVLAALVGFIGICELGRRIKCYYVYRFSERMISKYRFGAFIRFWLQGLLDLGVVSSIQLNSVTST